MCKLQPTAKPVFHAIPIRAPISLWIYLASWWMQQIPREVRCGRCWNGVSKLPRTGSESYTVRMTSEQTEVLRTVAYRCVCGETVELSINEGGRCRKCDRRYDPCVVRHAETICLEPAAPSKEKPTKGDSLIGQRLGHFRIDALLGRGGMGTVYRALDLSLQRYVALKVIRKDAIGSQGSVHVDRLLQEARAQARVHHPNVVHIYFVSREERLPFLAMELVTGETLKDRMRSHEISFRETVSIALQVVSALARAAQFDIIHGDIKPANILLADQGRVVKLSDFGLARRLSRTQSTKKTKKSTIAGTPDYMAPEICLGETTTLQSDMYALGIMLFELSFGRYPYDVGESSIQARMESHVSSSVAYPEPWPPEVPEQWREILDRLLAKSPADRYPNYAALMRDLKAVQPVTLPPAGRINRGLAWLVDFLIASALLSMISPIVGEESWASFLVDRPLLRMIVASFSVLVPLAAMWLQGYWGKTPGKKMFQLRIVDMNGLPPTRPKLFARAAAQFGMNWLQSIERILMSLGLAPLLFLVTPALVGLFLVDAGFALFSHSRRSLHDRLFGTQVVLDAEVTSPMGDETSFGR